VRNLTVQEVMQLAQVSHVTVYTWRKGTPTKGVLPWVHGSRPRSVEFEPKALKSWAATNGVQLAADPVALAKGKVTLQGAEFVSVDETDTKANPRATQVARKSHRKATH
jgi:transposase